MESLYNKMTYIYICIIATIIIIITIIISYIYIYTYYIFIYIYLNLQIYTPICTQKIYDDQIEDLSSKKGLKLVG